MKSAFDPAAYLVRRQVRWVRKEPETRFPRLVSLARRLDISGRHKDLLSEIDARASNPGNNWNRMIMSLLKDLAPACQEEFLITFMLNSGFRSVRKRARISKREGCLIPWAVLMDPTSSCNLHCSGCWAEDYEQGNSLETSLLDRIIREGTKLGTYIYIYSGGEPLVRKDDLLDLAERHPECMFLAFTNGTLVDEDFVRRSRASGNFMLAFSIEGFEEETDARRGPGSFRAVVASMESLAEAGVPFGFSTCYHRNNTETVSSDDYVDFLVSKGCRFGWYFTYMPLGRGGMTDYMATAEQRETMYWRIRELRSKKPVFLLDFWNDGEAVGGCIAGGKSYLHINSSGEVEPCAFIHFANVNIKDTSLLDALKSPIFREYAARRPFNGNHLLPCPLLDNPGVLEDIVRASGAHPTESGQAVTAEELCGRCAPAAERWKRRADAILRARAS